MASKTISVRLEAYERLKRAKRRASESFSGVIMRARWEDVLPCTDDVCWQYGQTFRYLRENGLLIGANDLWIAATPVAFGKPVVTRNERDFRRVPGLRVMGYGRGG